MQNEPFLSDEQIHSVQQSEYAQIHKIFIFVLIAQVLISLGFGLATESLLFGLSASVLIAIVPIVMVIISSQSAISRHAVGIGVQLMAALHIQQSMGMTEMHFQVFVLLAFLSFYRDWKVIVSATLVVAIHHILGFILQNMNAGLFVFEDSQPSLIILLIHASFAILECIVLAFMANNAHKEHIVAKELNATVKNIVTNDGSLDLREINIPNSSDLKELSNMLSAVRALVLRTNQVGLELLEIADKVKSSSDQLDNTVGEQNQQVSSITEAMQNITQSIHQVADLSQTTNNIAESAKSSTVDTRSSIEDSRQNIDQLKSTLETTATAISDLSEKCENISTVMQSIKSVAEQTNLLALNAAIESARAGEHGRGFAVVADEVRNLAIKSKDSAEEIEKITAMLTESANHSVNNMNNCVSVVELAVQSSKSATSNMTQVFSSIEKVNHNATYVANSATEQAQESKSISQSTQHLNILFNNEKEQVVFLQQDVHKMQALADQLDSQLKLFRLK